MSAGKSLGELIEAYGDALRIQEFPIAAAIRQEIERRAAGEPARPLVLPAAELTPPPAVVDPEQERINEVTAVLDEALRGARLPEPARDGDCLVWAPLVTKALSRAGVPAREVTVVGWVNPAQNLMGFMHKATLVSGPVVIDVTAQQFSATLPARWVTTAPVYCAELATACALAEVVLRVGGDELSWSAP